MSENEESMPDKELEECRKYKIGVPPLKTFKLGLRFAPDVTTRDLKKIILPIELKGVGRTAEIKREVLVDIKPSKVNIEPIILEFEDKVVTGKSYPATKEIILMNIQPNDTLKWQINKEAIEDESVWQINPYEGNLDAAASMTLRVNFNPQTQKEYIKKVSLYLDGVTDTPYTEFTLKGKGTTPKLTYDKTEIIVPPAPLGIESKALFKVKNLGYENLDLSQYKIRFLDYPPEGELVTLGFPENTKAVNVSKKDLKIEALFKSNKPINMTAKIEFQDSIASQPDTIDVSAVADNCILTVYSFYLRNKDEYEFVQVGNTIRLESKGTESEGEDASNLNPIKPSGRAPSKAGSTISKNSRKALTMIGYTPVSPALQRKACEYIKRWLNCNASSGTVQHFPQDVIKEQGRQIFDLLFFLTGKQFVPPAQPAPQPNPANPTAPAPAVPGAASNSALTAREEDTDEISRSRFEWLLTELTKYGAMLNTIRPEHLLSEDEYKRIAKKFKGAAAPEVLAVGSISQRFSHLSEEAWITLFYQIMKIFYLRRINVANFKSSSCVPPSEKLPIPNTSNIYSDSEMLLLKWLDYHYKEQNVYQHKNIIDFEECLRDSLVFASVIKAYCKNVKGLINLKPVLKTNDDYKVNATKIIYTLKTELQLRTHITEEDIIEPSAREMVIFCTQLFLYLPHYIPCDTIVFTCVLSQNVTKTIELKNDNKDRISYYAQLEGSTDFEIGEKKFITIEPGKMENFPVTFKSRISKPVEATLMFNNSADGPKQAAPLVFKLISNVPKRISADIITQNSDSNLYEAKEIVIDILNKFAKNARFSIELKYEKKKPPEPVQKKKKAGKKERANEQSDELSKFIPEPFYMRQDVITINKGQTQSLPVIFMPFELGTHRCQIVLIDNDVGELQYEIIANAKLPSPYSEAIIKTFPTEATQTIEIPITFRNIKMDSARSTLQSQSIKDRKEREKINWENYKRCLQDQQQFEVKISDTTGVFKIANTLVVQDRNPMKKDPSKIEASRMMSEMASDKNEDAKLSITFFAKVVKKYETRIMISNPSKTDVRIYDIAVRTHPPPVHGQLTFNVPARHQVIQEIPINNESDREWSVKVELTYDRTKPCKFDIGKMDFLAPKKQVTNIQLRFIPEWTCECTGKLTINIISTNQVFIYELMGKGEEPLAEGTITMQCEAKKPKKEVIAITNETDRMVQYGVETDMTKVLSGEATFRIMPKETYRYTLLASPLVGGVDMGSITFLDQDGHYIWYVVELHVRSPEVAEEKKLETYVRAPIVCEFAIKNPLNEAVTFEVDIRGEGLLGDPMFAIPANQTRSYELVFAPLKAGESQGYINFVSEKAGESKFKLALKAEDSQVKSIDFKEVELGRQEMQTVPLENPTKEEQLIISHNSNPTNFDVPEKILIPPYSQYEAPIKYTPSNLDATENARIVFESKNIGKWEFVVEGRGKPPTEIKLDRITTTVGDTIPSSITFKNPLKEQATIEITLEPEDSKEFVLLVKKPKIVLNPLSSYTIPFQFTPHSMTVVKVVLSLIWRYLLEGDAEHLSHNAPYTIKCQSRKRNQDVWKIQLPDLVEAKPDDEFSITAVPKDPTLQGLIEKSVVLELARTKLSKVDEPLECNVKFEPLRPFKAQSELIISKLTSGGRWRFGAVFEASDPEIDDVIEIKSPLHKTSSISFKLCNHRSIPSEFQAFFTHDSATEFSIYPKSGTLEQLGKEGTNFIVSFTPTEYGKNKTGKLIIQTEEMQWTYEIRGSHPEYKVPKPKGGRLDNKLSKDLESKLFRKSGMDASKNFIMNNIKKQKDTDVRAQTAAKKKSEARGPSPGRSKIEFNISKSSAKQ